MILRQHLYQSLRQPSQLAEPTPHPIKPSSPPLPIQNNHRIKQSHADREVKGGGFREGEGEVERVAWKQPCGQGDKVSLPGPPGHDKGETTGGRGQRESFRECLRAYTYTHVHSLTREHKNFMEVPVHTPCHSSEDPVNNNTLMVLPRGTEMVRGRGVTHKSENTERGRGMRVTNLVYGFLIALRDGRTKEKKAEKKKR